MRSPPVAEHGQRPRPGAKILGPSARSTGPFILHNAAKTTPAGTERLSLVCKVLLGLCLAYVVVASVAGWSASHGGGQQRQGLVHKDDGPESVPAGGRKEAPLAPEPAPSQTRSRLMRGGAFFPQQDQFLRKPRSTATGFDYDQKDLYKNKSNGKVYIASIILV